jgi:hypothetical protein
LRHAEQPEGEIVIVDLGEHYAAAEFRTRGIGQAIILIRVPIRKVFGVVDLRTADVAERAGHDELLEPTNTWVEAPLTPDECHEPPGRDGIHQAADTVERVGYRLFDEEVAARVGCTLRNLEMLACGCAYEHGVRLGRERNTKIVERLHAEV